MAIHQEGLIICNPEILHGKPVVKGTRISVALILQNIASGMTKEDILRGYPTLTTEGIDAALAKKLNYLQAKSEHENTIPKLIEN